MSLNVDIKLKRADKVYHEGETVSGVIIISSPTDFKHEGITLTAEGAVNLQVSSRNVGILEALYNSIKPIQLLRTECEVSLSGARLPAGRTEIPFELPLKPKGSGSSAVLYETYHGVYINISYGVKCEVKRSKFLPLKGVQKYQQILVQRTDRPGGRPVGAADSENRPVNFELSPKTLTTGGGVGVPDFLLRGRLNTVCCDIRKPFEGHVTLVKCSVPVRSMELQLVRVETCGCAEGYAREATEIQNIQIGDGDIARDLPIRIYMIFPRLFTCPTLITTNFKIEFEVNLVIVFDDDHLITNNFPIILRRGA